MCGIGAVYLFRKRYALKYALSIAVNQEYRGRASTGVGFLWHGKIFVVKDTIPPREFAARMPALRVRVAIVHNRQPSVGAVSVENAHPFLDCRERFALIHNGTITNMELITPFLSSHKIKGDTDSELLTHYICELLNHKNKLIDIVKFLSEILYRQNVIILTRHGEIYGWGDDIIISSTEDGYFIAQTTSALPNGKLLKPDRWFAIIKGKLVNVKKYQPRRVLSYYYKRNVWYEGSVFCPYQTIDECPFRQDYGDEAYKYCPYRREECERHEDKM